MQRKWGRAPDRGSENDAYGQRALPMNDSPQQVPDLHFAESDSRQGPATMTRKPSVRQQKNLPSWEEQKKSVPSSERQHHSTLQPPQPQRQPMPSHPRSQQPQPYPKIQEESSSNLTSARHQKQHQQRNVRQRQRNQSTAPPTYDNEKQNVNRSETLAAVIAHAEQRRRQFGERAARAEAEHDRLISQGMAGSVEVQQAEARRAAAIAAFAALTGQLEIFRRVQEEARSWREEDLARSTEGSKHSASPHGLTPVESASRALRSLMPSRDWRRKQAASRSAARNISSQETSHDRGHLRQNVGSRVNDYDDDMEEFNQYNSGVESGDDVYSEEEDYDDDEAAELAEENRAEEFEREQRRMEDAIENQRAEVEEQGELLEEAKAEAADALAEHQSHVDRLQNVLLQSVDPDYGMLSFQDEMRKWSNKSAAP